MLLIPFLTRDKSPLKSWVELISYGLKKNKWWQLTFGFAGSIIGYILFPTIKDFIIGKRIQGSVSNRDDKYTTGLVNKGNYCYVNSALQALSSSENMSRYLNVMYGVINEESLQENSIPSYDLRLHVALYKLLRCLQSLINTPNTTTTTEVTRTMENIYQSRLSSSQNDAHEFLQILLERLDTELQYCSILESKGLPYKGTVSEEFTCTRCRGISKAKSTTFTIFEAHLPQKQFITLEELLLNNSSDVITDYSCLVCNARAIISLEESYEFKGTSETLKQEMLELKSRLTSIKINDDISPQLEAFFQTYSRYGYNRDAMKTTIFKRTTFVSSPSTLIIHLSRSTYNGMVYSRNNCKVKYPETLIANGQGDLKVNYQLKSVVKHTGNHYSGHYQCYRRKPILKRDRTTKKVVNTTTMIGAGTMTIGNNNLRKLKSITEFPFWFLSDATTREKRLADVLDEEKSAYLLIYEKL
ncbi:Uncharacterized protein RNJ44_03803 [Nakaseomyces bracarensis]|uniref:Ubiquitin carboxyl-terminal hydrolase n=1 Tax=Nakaseomyces bracarensis TaxID=273131 RepID=A0ABR4NXY7_9SACH